MAFQSPQTREKDPILNHYNLVKDGPKKVTIKGAPKWVKNNTLCVVEVFVDGKQHAYFTNNPEIAAKFSQHIGKEVVLVASGNSKRGTDSMEIHEVAIGQVPQPAPSKPVSATPVAKPVQTPAISSDTEVKKYLCQASNLMRLCVKKANDIAVEMGLPPEHRQGIATTLFIQSDRMGHVSKMPISPFSPEELGYGASKATNLANPQPQGE